MLPFKNRLLSKQDFEKIKRKGQKFQGRFFGFLVFQTHLGFSRFGFIISKKISKKAIQRNRTKRLLRETVRTLLPVLRPGFDILILGKKDLMEKSLAEIQSEMQWLLGKSGVIKFEERSKQ